MGEVVKLRKRNRAQRLVQAVKLYRKRPPKGSGEPNAPSPEELKAKEPPPEVA